MNSWEFHVCDRCIPILLLVSAEEVVLWDHLRNDFVLHLALLYRFLSSSHRFLGADADGWVGLGKCFFPEVGIQDSFRIHMLPDVTMVLASVAEHIGWFFMFQSFLGAMSHESHPKGSLVRESPLPLKVSQVADWWNDAQAQIYWILSKSIWETNFLVPHRHCIVMSIRSIDPNIFWLFGLIR